VSGLELLRVLFLALAGLILLEVDRRWDLPAGRIPNAISLPLWGIGTALALAAGDLTGMILWPAFFLGWQAGGVGAGDAKIWMGLSAAAGIGPTAAGLAALVLLARLRAARMGWGIWAGLVPRGAPIPMSAPSAAMAAAAALARILWVG
jgi:hypothetical protein